MEKLISREESESVLLNLAECGVLQEDIAEALEQIAVILRAESIGLMLWGAGEDVSEVYNIIAMDRCTLDMRRRHQAVFATYGYEPGGGE